MKTILLLPVLPLWLLLATQANAQVYHLHLSDNTCRITECVDTPQGVKPLGQTWKGNTFHDRFTLDFDRAIFTWEKEGKEKTYNIYNVCDNQECYKEVGSQAISYTTGVPAMCGALMMLTGKWIRPGVYTVEEFDPDPFLEALDKYGLPRSENHDPELVD